MAARSRSRESFSGKRRDQRWKNARPLPDLESFLIPTPDHYRLVTSESGRTTNSVLCDCELHTNHA